MFDRWFVHMTFFQKNTTENQIILIEVKQNFNNFVRENEFVYLNSNFNKIFQVESKKNW